MNVIRYICPHGLPTVSDLVVSDEGEVLKMTSYLITDVQGTLTVAGELPEGEGDLFIMSKEQELIDENPDSYNLPSINKQ